MSDQGNQSFRVAVLGAGAMGSLFGGSLFEGGAEVTLTTSTSLSAALNSAGSAASAFRAAQEGHAKARDREAFVRIIDEFEQPFCGAAYRCLRTDFLSVREITWRRGPQEPIGPPGS